MPDNTTTCTNCDHKGCVWVTLGSFGCYMKCPVCNGTKRRPMTEKEVLEAALEELRSAREGDRASLRHNVV